MRRTTTRGRRIGELAVDLGGLAALFAGALALSTLVHGRNAVAFEAIDVLACTAGLAAAILLAAVAGLTGSARTGRIAGAVALYAGVALLVRAAGLENPLNVWVLASCTAVLGALGMLALAVSGSFAGRAGRQADALVGGLTLGCVGLLVAAAFAWPGWAPAPWAVITVDVIAWSGAGAAGLVALVAGARSGRALVRRTGIAFGTISAAHALRIVTGGAPGSDSGVVNTSLELAGVGMLLVAAVAFFVAVARGLRRPHGPRLATVVHIPVPRGADGTTGRSVGAVRVPIQGVTVGPVTDGLRLIAVPPPVGGPGDTATAPGSSVGNTAKHWSRATGIRRPRPGRARPPGRRGHG